LQRLSQRLWGIEAQSRDPNIPRSSDGRPNLSAPAPRLNGKPDLSGVWQAERTPVAEFVPVLGPGLPEIQPDLNDITKHVLNVLWDVPPRRASAQAGERRHHGATAEERPGFSDRVLSTSQCACRDVHNGVQNDSSSSPDRGSGGQRRPCTADLHRRSLPKDPEPSWMGSSVGHWQGETLVVVTTGFKESAWRDGFGHPRSEAMHITERYRRRDVGHMDLELTFDDPKYYTRPFCFKTTLTLFPDTDVLEYVCMENQRRYRPPDVTK
jgi:hypothetical protein